MQEKRKKNQIAHARDIKRGNENVHPNMKARGGMGTNIKEHTVERGKAQNQRGSRLLHFGL